MKIDITKLDGYREDMTAEEKVALYEAYEYEPDYTGYVKKDVFDKKASEAASLSRELKGYKEKEMTGSNYSSSFRFMLNIMSLP